MSFGEGVFIGIMLGLLTSAIGCITLVDPPGLVRREVYAEANQHGCGAYVVKDPATGATEWQWGQK